MIQDCQHLYNIKCLRNIYFICSVLLSMKYMLVFIFIKKKILLSFGPPGLNPGSVLVYKFGNAP